MNVLQLKIVYRAWAVMLFLGVESTAVASDFFPPTWRRNPLTTRSVWEFNLQPADLGFMEADRFDSVGDGVHELDPLYDPPKANADPANFEWMEDGRLHNKIAEFQLISFGISNWIDEQPKKIARIQYHFACADPIFDPVHVYQFAGFKGLSISYGRQIDHGGTTSFRWEDWEIEPNPNHETFDIYIPDGGYLDQIVIDTISLPEPSAISVLATAVFGIARRRQR